MIECEQHLIYDLQQRAICFAIAVSQCRRIWNEFWLSYDRYSTSYLRFGKCQSLIYFKPSNKYAITIFLFFFASVLFSTIYWEHAKIYSQNVEKSQYFPLPKREIFNHHLAKFEPASFPTSLTESDWKRAGTKGIDKVYPKFVHIIYC